MASEPLRQHRRDIDRWLPSSRQPTESAVAEEMLQRTSFEDGDERRGRLMAAIDAIEDWHGRWTMVPALQGFRRDWRMQAANRSPRWTTRIAEVPVVAAE